MVARYKLDIYPNISTCLTATAKVYINPTRKPQRWEDQ